MKPSKKKPAKRAVRTGSVEHKLMKLLYRIDKKQTSDMKHIDKEWVKVAINTIRTVGDISKGRMLRANDMWRKYE